MDTTVQYCVPSDVMVIWLMEEEQQTPYELHCIVAFLIPLGLRSWFHYTCIRGVFLYKVSSLHLSKSSSTGQNNFSCCHRASSVIKEGPLILMWKHQHCQELGFIFNSVQRKICSLDNLDINVADNSPFTREYVIYCQFPSIWCFLCVPQTAKDKSLA